MVAICLLMEACTASLGEPPVGSGLHVPQIHLSLSHSMGLEHCLQSGQFVGAASMLPDANLFKCSEVATSLSVCVSRCTESRGGWRYTVALVVVVAAGVVVAGW